MDSSDGNDAGGLTGMDNCDGPGDGFDGLDLGFDSAGLGEYGFDAIGSDGHDTLIPDPRRRDFNRETVSDTLLLSFDHCDVYDGGQSCLGGGYDLVDAVKGTFEDDVYDPDGSTRPLDKRRLTPEQIEIVKKMADDPRRRMFGIHVANHGLAFLEQDWKKIAEEAGCVRIDTVTPNFFASSELLPELADWNNWRPPFTRRRVPAGFYPDAHGTTTIWKQYWQVKHGQEGWLFEHEGPKHNPNWRFDRFCNTVLEITCVTWYYREACDYETRFHIKVLSTPYLDPHDKQWGYLKKPFKRYKQVARQLCELMLRRLKACPPHPIAVKRRGEILKRLRAEAEARRTVPQDSTPADSRAPQPVRQTVSVKGCPRSSGADLGAALEAKAVSQQSETVVVTVTLPRRQ